MSDLEQSDAIKLFVVRRVPNEECEEGDEYQRAFSDRSAAEAYCRERTASELQRRTVLNGLWSEYAIGRGAAALAADIEALGLPPPPVYPRGGRWDYPAFRAWWRSIVPLLTPELTEALWAIGRPPELYKVVEVPLEG